jgi:hypothetical protein
MAATATTTVEIDNELLSRLRERSPGKNDREALERAARIQLGFETIPRAQERSAAAGVRWIRRSICTRRAFDLIGPTPFCAELRDRVR